MIYLETGSVNPYYNLAFEEYVLRNKTAGDYLILWQNNNTIVIGNNQTPSEEINAQFTEEHNINVVRRITGGGAVYHDLGNLNYSFITDLGDPKTATMERFSKPLVEVLKSLGLDAKVSGRNDILIGEKKVSGTAQRIAGSRILYHGTLLFDSDPDMISGALNPDPTKFLSKSTKSVKARVGNIRDMLEKDMDIRTFRDYIKARLCGLSGENRTPDNLPADNIADALREKVHINRFPNELKPDEIPAKANAYALSEEDIREIDNLFHNKYLTKEWNLGRTPEFDFSASKRFAAGKLDIRIKTKNGIITDAAFYGDFLSSKPTDMIRDRFIGSYFTKDAVSIALDCEDLPFVFGGITKDQILGLMFG